MKVMIISEVFCCTFNSCSKYSNLFRVSTRHGEYSTCSLKLHPWCYRWSALEAPHNKLQRYCKSTNTWSNITHNPPSSANPYWKNRHNLGPFLTLNIIQIKCFPLQKTASKLHSLYLAAPALLDPCSLLQHSQNTFSEFRTGMVSPKYCICI